MASKFPRAQAPALPEPANQYSPLWASKFNNILRIYFRQLDSELRRISTGLVVSEKTYTAPTGNYTITTTNYLVEYTTGSFTVTLPTAAGIQGHEFQIKNSGTGSITVDADGTETIDGSLTKTLVQYDAMKIMSNGINWIIV